MLKSQAQRAWMHANEPEMAERWEAETPKGKKLPERLHPRKTKKKRVIPASRFHKEVFG